jgi:opacity protein-like surface antigen
MTQLTGIKAILVATATMLLGVSPALSQIRCNIEGSVGIAASIMNIDRSSDGFNTGDNDAGQQGFIGALGAGCDWYAQQPYVIGLLARYNFASLSGTEKEEKFELGDFWSVGVRLGYRFNQSVMAYGIAGWSETEISRIGHNGAWRPEGTAGGLWLGGGLEVNLTDTWAGRLEYSWHDFEKVDLQPAQATADLHVVRAALVYRFGGAPWEK